MEATNTVRTYEVGATSTAVHGRVLCSVRNHHFIVDGPVQNGCPGEEVTPAELFLSAVAACGVELIQSFAREIAPGLRGIVVRISGWMDRARPVRADLSVLNAVRLEFRLAGVSAEQGAALVGRFKGR